MHNEICKEQLAPKITFSQSVLFLGTHMETQFFPSTDMLEHAKEYGGGLNIHKTEIVKLY